MKPRLTPEDIQYVRDFQSLLRESRIALRIDQRDAAREAGLTPQQLCRIERGKGLSFSWLTAAKLIRFYGLDLSDILPDCE